MSEIAERLLNPAHRVGMDGLLAGWLGVEIEALVPGHGVLAGEADVLRKLRGALGAVLLRGASREAKGGRPCPWEPPCALDILFREQARIAGGRGIPKPWALAADERGPDLVLRLTLFGFAGDWAPAISLVLADAIMHGLEWSRIRPDLFRPAPVVTMLQVRERRVPPIGHIPAEGRIVFVTPLEAEATDLREAPWAVLPRAMRRVALLARWMDMDAEAMVETIAVQARSIDFDVSDLATHGVRRRSGRAAQAFEQPMHRGSIGLAGLLETAWPLLVLAEQAHLGRGATSGFGRIRLFGTQAKEERSKGVPHQGQALIGAGASRPSF